jgi:hypothetical protein
VTSASRWLGILGCLSAVTACRRDRAASPAPPAASEPAAADAVADVHVRLPDRWVGVSRIVLDTLSTRERGSARHGARVYSYLPKDSSLRPQALAVVAVYDSAAWAAVRAEGGPPPGDSVGQQAGLVYVVALAQSNPFVPGTPDAAGFDSLQLSTDEAARLIELEP